MKARCILFTSLASLFATLACAQLSEPDTVFYGRVVHHGGGEPYVLTSGSLAWSILPQDGSAAGTVKADLSPLQDGAFSYSVRVPRYLAVSGLPEYSVPAGLPVLADHTKRYRHAAITVNGEVARIADPAALSFAADGATRADFLRLDLIVDYPLPDADGDGLPDWWENKYGLDPQTAGSPGADSDGDGLSDLAEYRAGTHPGQEGTAPLIAAETSVTIPENGRSALIIRAQDSDTPPAQLRYTVLALPEAVTLTVDDRLSSEFTQAEVNAGQVVFSATTPVRDLAVAINLVDEVPGREPVKATLRLATVSREDLLAVARLRDASVPADYILHHAAAATIAMILRAPSGPAELLDGLSTAAYAETWTPRRGADSSRVFIGSPQDDVLLGSGESDVLAAGAGINNLRGYAGADRFVFTEIGAQDTITDFSPGEGDVLDVSALLMPVPGRPLSAYLSLQSGPVLRVDADGDGSGFTDATISLTGALLPTQLDDVWDAGLIDSGSVVPRTTLFVTATAASEEGLAAGVITFRRRGDATLSLTVPLSVTGTATAGNDYVSLPNSVTFAAGKKTATLEVIPLADDLREPLETIEIAIAPESAYVLGNAGATVALIDLPSRVWLEVAERTAYKDPLSPAEILIRRSGTLGSPLTVLLQTSGRATPAVDYRRPPGSVTFGAAQEVIALEITPLASANLTGGCEDVVLSLKADTSYQFGETPQVRVVICDHPQTLANWRSEHLPGQDPNTPAFYHTDSDGDGFDGLMEFALNLDPTAHDSGDKTLTRLVFDGTGRPGLEYRRWPGAPEIRYEVFRSTDLRDWQALTGADSFEASASLEADGLERVRHFIKTQSATGKVYLRLKVIRQ